ncbi:MAG TPA: hypothetical protein VF444_14850 [Pseudonocardiaceae bacterium]
MVVSLRRRLHRRRGLHWRSREWYGPAKHAGRGGEVQRTVDGGPDHWVGLQGYDRLV